MSGVEDQVRRFERFRAKKGKGPKENKYADLKLEALAKTQKIPDEYFSSSFRLAPEFFQVKSRDELTA